MGKYCCYLLQKNDGGSYQILVNPTKVSDHQVNVQPDIGCAGHVWVEVDVVGVEVVLDDVLVDPADGGAPDPALRQPQQPVHARVPAHRTVVGVVLHVQTYQRFIIWW